ncbi:MAG: dihydrodipicolinate synthase family protein [Betaproteobacteria bacterium]|nr:dihydrodipicolinate synthase family protein [Betaproteobacteria bacterium]
MSTPRKRTGQPLRSVPKGVMHVPVTPFMAHMAVDYDTFEKLVDWHVRQNPSSLCVVLHIAESVSLTREEHKKLIEISVSVTNGRVPVIANVSMAGTDQAIDLARHAEKAGADAIICLSPYYWPVPEEALHDHFIRIAKATPLPFMIYNSPIFQGVSLSPKFLVRLMHELPNFIGEKEASHNFEYFIEARRATQAVRPEFGLLLGVEYIIPSVSMGGVGSMSIAGGVAPRLMQKLYDLCAAGKFFEAAPLQDKASHLWQLFKPEYPAAIKAAMEMMGRPVGPVRGPMRSLDAGQKQKLRKELEGIGVFDGGEPTGW